VSKRREKDRERTRVLIAVELQRFGDLNEKVWESRGRKKGPYEEVLEPGKRSVGVKEREEKGGGGEKRVGGKRT
jgi:hypothetical protein